jgi:hypothetical protein
MVMFSWRSQLLSSDSQPVAPAAGASRSGGKAGQAHVGGEGPGGVRVQDARLPTRMGGGGGGRVSMGQDGAPAIEGCLSGRTPAEKRFSAGGPSGGGLLAWRAWPSIFTSPTRAVTIC